VTGSIAPSRLEKPETDRKYNKLYIPPPHSLGFQCCTTLSVIFKEPHSIKNELVGILHVTGIKEYTNFIAGLKDIYSKNPALRHKTYLKDILTGTAPRAPYIYANGLPKLKLWEYLLLWRSYRCQFQRIEIREGDFFALGPMVWSFWNIKKNHTGFMIYDVNSPLTYLMAVGNRKLQ